MLLVFGALASLLMHEVCAPLFEGQKHDFRDARQLLEAVQCPTMKITASKSAEQLDLQALQRRGAPRWPLAKVRHIAGMFFEADKRIGQATRHSIAFHSRNSGFSLVSSGLYK